MIQRWFALFFFVCEAVFAEAPAPRENYLDLISKAENLTLQHDRLQATQILLRAIKAEKPGSVASRQLRKSLGQLAEIFYGEKAQKSYELAQSIVDPKMAIEKYNEALQAEPGNTRILRGVARAKIRLQECAEAARVAESGLEEDPFSSELQLVRVQALQCAEEHEAVRAYLNTPSEGLRSLKPFFEMVQIRDLMALKRWTEARKRARDLVAQEPAFPEPLVVLFRTGQELKLMDLEAGEKYVAICQKSVESLRKKYELEPNICFSLKDMENEVKTLHNQEDKSL